MIVIIACVLSAILAFSQSKIHRQKTNYLFPALVLVAVMIFRLGCLPVGWGFSGDRNNYAHEFLSIKYGGFSFSLDGKDPFWGFIRFIISPFGEAEVFFIFQSAIYVALYFFACQRLSGKNSFWLLITVIASMGFTSYGVNTLRAGMAFALIIFGLSYWTRPVVMYSFFAMALLTHLSMVIPLTMIVICRYCNNTKLYFYIWFVCVFVSIAAGNFFNGLFSTFIEDDRTKYLTTINEAYKQGFRWDFVIYSLAPILVGAYYIFKRGFHDKFYHMLYNSYILTNCFWVLVIRANYTDRFAYLSWFMLPFILVYPLLRPDAPVKRPNQWLAVILLSEAAFAMIV